MSALTQAVDGDFTARSLVAPTKITRPFLNWPTKDSATKLFERLYEIDRGSYSPFAALATLPNDGTEDPADAAAYLLTESEPDLAEDGTTRVRCLFGHVPPNQVQYSTLSLTKPDPTQFATFAREFYSSIDTSTQDGWLYTYNSYWFGRGRIWGARKICTSVNSGANTRVTCTAHGFSAGTPLAARNDNASLGTYTFDAGEFTVVDANTIDLLGVNHGTGITQIAPQLRTYTPGVARVKTRLTHKFYLIGVGGISTIADIPTPAVAVSELALVDLIIANLTGYQSYDADPLTHWPTEQSPMFLQRLIEIDMASIT